MSPMLRRVLRPRNSNYDAAQAQLLQAQANDVKAQNDLMRYKQLVDKQEISQQHVRSGRGGSGGRRCGSGRRESDRAAAARSR